MNYEEVTELHYITPMVNLKSILAEGILSNERASGLVHASVAMNAIQERRDSVVVPNRSGPRKLHTYANLYFHARNPMLYLRRNQHNDLCVLRINRAVLNVPGVVVTDQNASSGYVRFGDGINGLRVVNHALTFAEYWTSTNEIDGYQRKSARCAEVLVPDCVPASLIDGVYVSSNENVVPASEMCESGRVTVTAYPWLFFR
jgi:hypothetical protein